MFLGSGDEFRLNLKQPADGDPTLRGNLRPGDVVPPAADRPGSAAWARTSTRRSPPASARSTRTSRVGRSARLQLHGLRPVPARRVAREARLARQADRRLRRPGRRASTSSTSGRSSSRPRATRATSPARSPACRRRRSRAGSRSYRPAGYLEALIQAGERLTLVPGVRVDYYSEIEKGSVNPRLTARFKLAQQTDAEGRASASSRSRRSTARPWPRSATRTWASRHAQHYGLGVEQRFGARRQRQRRRLLQAPQRSGGQRRRARRQPAARERRQGAHLRPGGARQAQPDRARVRLRRRTRCRAASATTTARPGACSTTTRRTS